MVAADVADGEARDQLATSNQRVAAIDLRKRHREFGRRRIVHAIRGAVDVLEGAVPLVVEARRSGIANQPFELERPPVVSSDRATAAGSSLTEALRMVGGDTRVEVIGRKPPAREMPRPLRAGELSSRTRCTGRPFACIRCAAS